MMNPTRGVLTVFLTLAIATTFTLVAETISIAPLKDTSLYEHVSGEEANGSGNHLFIGRNSIGGGGTRYRTLLYFDVKNVLPKGAIVTSAVLRMNMSVTVIGAQDATIYRASRRWGEGASAAVGAEGVGTAPASGDATWLHTFYSTNFWSSAGGDFDPTPRAVTSIDGVGSYAWSSTQMVADVQAWLNNPATNQGWIILGNELSFPTAKRFDSRTHPTPANRPVLEVGFTRPVQPFDRRISVAIELLDSTEVPPVVNGFSGTGIFSYDFGNRQLSHVIHHNVTNIIDAHIHGPAGVGTNAGIVFGLTLSNPIVGTNTLTATQENQLLGGLFYVNIHSTVHPGGAIRGQLRANLTHSAHLTPEQEVPPTPSTRSGSAVLTYNPVTRSLTYRILHNITNASIAHIHGVAPDGINAGILIDLGSGVSPIAGAVTLTLPQEAALMKELLYINVHSVTFPSGEIRGQLRAVEAVPEFTHTALLNGQTEVPPLTNDFHGVGLFALDRASQSLWYSIYHSVTDATAAHIHGPSGVGTNSGILFDLGIASSPLQGSIGLSAAEMAQLGNHLWYVNVHNPAFPSGAIRGQIETVHKYACALQGRQEVPTITTAHRGAGIFAYNPATRELGYQIHHSLGAPTAAHIHGPARPGVSAGIVHDFGSAANPIMGSVILTAGQELLLRQGLLYVNVHSSLNPAGEIRGQILPVDGRAEPFMTAVISSLQETPPLTNALNGTALLSYDFATRLLSWRVEHNVTDATAVHIHGPAPAGTPAGIVVDMGVPSIPIVGRTVLTPAQQADLLNGLYYINIHNPVHPAGVTRGQILATDRFAMSLQGITETPARTTLATGEGAFFYSRASRTLFYTIHHSVPTPTAAHIHGPGPEGVSAGILYDLGSAVSPMSGSVILTAAHEQDLFNRRLYVNVHSPKFPPGELRGQILPVEPVKTITHTAVLTGGEEVPPVVTLNEGIGVFTYDCENRILHAEVHHSITNPTAAHIHGPAGVGTNNIIVFGFRSGDSPIRDSFVLSPSQAAELQSGLYYVNVHSDTHVAGEIRGQIIVTNRAVCVLQGRQEVPIVTTEAMGFGVFRPGSSPTQIVYTIHHSVTNPTDAHVHGISDPGVNSGILIGFPSAVSPMTGTFNLTESQLVEFMRGRTYVNVHSTKAPGGEIRGQIVQAFPDSDCNGIDDHWELDHGFTPGAYDPNDDHDGDGVTTRDEFLAGTDPMSDTSFPAIGHIESGVTTLTFDTSPFRYYAVQKATNLANQVWTSLANNITGTVSGVLVTDTNDHDEVYYRLGIESRPVQP